MGNHPALTLLVILAGVIYYALMMTYAAKVTRKEIDH